MVEDRWGNHDGVDEPTSTTNLNGTRPLPIIQTRIPKIAKSVTSDAPPPSREQDIADRERLRNNLINLQALLEKTSRKVGDVARNFRGRDINQCPVYAENLKLQQDVEKRIEEVKGNLFEISRRLGSLKEPKEEEKRGGEETVDVSIPRPIIEEEEDNSDKIFIDPGTHWCKQCDLFSTDVSSYLKHLQSDKHWKSCESKEEPWRRTVSNKPKSDDHDKKVTVDIKGTHSLMPIRGFYCQVCGVLLGSQSHAEDHLKTNKHTRCYNRHVLMNGQVELNYSVSKSRALSKVQKRQRELEEKEEREKEAKKRATENEMKKRALEDKDKENQRKRIKESSERSFQPTNEYSKKKEPDRERDRDREESKDREREKEREREKDRDREKERERERERIKEKVKKSFSSSNKLSSHSKDKERNRAKDREREKDSHKNKLKRADDSRRSEKIVKSTTIIEPVEEDVFGPHWPFNDNKLAMKTSVFIPKKEWQLCYKKHIKLMMLGKLPTMSKKSDPKPDANSQAEEVQKPLSPPPSPEPAENVDSSIGDLVLSITCDKGSSDNEFDIDKDKDPNNDLKDMFTVEFDDEDANAEKINESDFVVSQDVDFPKLEPLVINGDLNDSSIPNTPADDQMLSPPAWAQPLSLHDLAE